MTNNVDKTAALKFIERVGMIRDDGCCLELPPCIHNSARILLGHLPVYEHEEPGASYAGLATFQVLQTIKGRADEIMQIEGETPTGILAWLLRELADAVGRQE